MDCCTNVEKEVDKVLNKLKNFKEDYSQKITDVIEHGKRVIEILDAEPSSAQCFPSAEMVGELCLRVRTLLSQLSTEHRELHGAVSKVGKAIDKNFISDFACTTTKDIFRSDENKVLLNQLISEHFLRQGMLDLAEQLIQETKLDLEPEKRRPFSELNSILDSLKRQDLEPALRWAAEHREQLAKQNSPLEFKLHRLRYISLLQASQFQEAIAYARAHFPPFAPQHHHEIQVLMGSLLYSNYGIDRSPYHSLFDPSHWIEICDVFTRDACALLGLSFESPLTVCVNAGCTALPALLNIRQVMAQRQVQLWGREELPVEIDVGGRYHSVFACPILRQQSTPANPPMRLVCGHVISRDALHKLANANKLKCPYCPVEQNPSDARLIHF